MTFCRNSRATCAQVILAVLLLAACAFTAAAQNPTETGLMINGPDARAARMTTIGASLTAPDTGAIEVNVFAERNGTRVDRQALLKLIDRATQRAVWATTDDRSQGVFTNIAYGTYDVEASAVGYFSARHEVLISPAVSQMVIDMVLRRDPDAVNLDVGTATLSPKARKETKHAVQAFKSGKLKDAEKHLEEAYKSSPSDANINFLMGYLYFQKKDFTRAINYLNVSTSANAHNAQALTLLGRAGLEQSDYPVARSALEQAVLADAENWLPHNLLAFTYLHQRDYAKARDEARVSITKDKNAAVSSQLILGESLLNLGQPSDGVHALRVFLDQAPQHPLAEQVRKAIAQVDHQSSNVTQTTTVARSEAPVAPIASLEGLPSPKFSVKPWMPPGIDEVKAAIAPDVACPADSVIAESSKRAQELVANVSRFAAIEDLFHQSLDEFGNPNRTETRKYNYVASITESEPGYLAVNEYRSDQITASDYPDRIASTGFAGLAFVFHPDVRDSFEMKCEGLGDWHGQATWLVHFRQRDDRPNRMHSYKVGDQLHPVKLKGRAWITSDKFQIVRMEAEMVAPMPEIELQSEHQVVEYAPIPFPQKDTTLWLPKSAEIYFDFRKHRYYRRHSFDHYMLFSVDTEEKHKKPVSAKPHGS
jgi:tetratricopeptide (TPR) repeat protein